MASKTTASQVIKAAKGEIRVAPYTRPNKYTKWYYGNETSASWCGIFVKYVIEKLCSDKTLLKGCTNVAYVPNIYNWAKQNGYIKYSPKKGDLIIFDWSVGNGVNMDHVGFFVKDNGNGTITTIEGNTSNASNGDGNCVQQRVREKKWVLCYVRLPYKAETVKVTQKSKYTGKLPTTYISATNYTKSETKLWQKFLNWALNAGLKEDGEFGTMTYKATKEFQKRCGLAEDGIVGPKTLALAKDYEK